MTFTGPYDANRIGINGYFNSGVGDINLRTYEEVMEANTNFSLINAPIRLGPWVDRGNGEPEFRCLKEGFVKFRTNFYVPESHLDQMQVRPPERKLGLREAFEELEKRVNACES